MDRNDVLKNFALKAKRRLVTGKSAAPLNTKIKVIESEDNEFKSKVEFLLAQEGVVSNPVQYLIDEKAIKGMSDVEKERYLLSTLDKYSALRNELENLSTQSRFCI